MTTAVRGVGTKRPRGYVATAEEAPLPWAGRVPKPAMDADSFVDYGSGFLRKSCDSCVSSKRRCDGHDPCTRCLRRKKPCHYTERKKCGPRSGQKTTNKMRRLYTAETQLRRRFTTEMQPQHERPNRAHPHPHDAGLTPDLGRSPPPHATPTLSAGELSGETTCVDQTDYSDNGLPSHQVLLRDESGSSWWSIDDQGAGTGGGGLPTRLSGDGGSWPQHHRQQHHHRQGNGKVCDRDRGDGAGGVGGAHYGYNELGHGGLWSGLHGSATTGTGSGSGGSAGESWEDDESEEGLGQAEEEVAVLLLGLGKANEEDFEGFSDDENDESGSSVSKTPAASQEWSV